MSDDDEEAGPVSDPKQNEIRELKELLKKFGPAPLPTFGKLPEETRAWLMSLRPEDINEIKEAVGFLRSARTVGWFGKWMMLTLIGAFIGAVTLGEKVQIAWKWVFSTGRAP